MTEPIPDFDLYGTLGVPRGTPPNAVVAAYRGLIRRAHPDVSSEPGSSDRSKRLNIARDWLIDPVRRARYNAARPGPADGRDRARSAWQRPRRDVDGQAAAWRVELEVFVAHCRALNRRELSRLLARATAEGPAREVATRAERLADRRGRAARIMHASEAARAALAFETFGRDPRLAELLRLTALGLAVADVAPLDAEVLLTAWRRAILEPELRARQRQQRLARINRTIRRVLGIAAVGPAAGLMLAGVVVAVAVAFGWAG
jgi:hypothetical protein